MSDPVPGVDIEAGIERFDFGEMDMSADKSKVAFRNPCTGIVMILFDERLARALAGMFARLVRDFQGQRVCQCGRKEPVKRSVEAVTQDALENPIFPVGRSQTVTVRGENSAVRSVEYNLVADQLEADLAAHEVPYPKVVVAAEVSDFETACDQFPQAEQNREIVLGDQVAIFEPEVEKVPENYKMVKVSRVFGEEFAEQLELAVFLFPIRLAKMKVGDKVDRHREAIYEARLR